ncbi:MAG: ABC transporter permease [Acidobacteriota bacterium]|jgi:predicted permease
MAEDTNRSRALPAASLFADLRFALGAFHRQFRLSAAAALCIALGIAATTAVVTLIDLTVFEPVPFRDADRLVRIWNERTVDRTRADLSWGGYTDVADLDSLDRLEATARARLIYITEDGSRRVDGEAVTPGYFDLLGIEAAAGRLFTPEEYLDGAEHVILISHAAWGAMYGYDPTAIGSELRTNTQNYRNPQIYTIVGVLPPFFVGTAEADFPDIEFWIPAYKYIAPRNRELRAGRLVETVGRLADDVTLEQARAELAPLSEELGRLYPRERQDVTHRIEYFGANWRERFEGGNGLLSGAAGLLLAVAAANVSGLLLARAVERRHELAIRGALGATRGEIARLLLLETMVVVIVGGAAGVLTAPRLLAYFVGVSSADLPGYMVVAPDTGVLVLSTAIIAVTGIAAGLLPAVAGMRSEIAAAIRQGSSRVAGSRGTHRAGNLLVIAEVALTVVLVVSSTLLLRSYAMLGAADLGFRTDGLLRMGIFIDLAEVPDSAGLPAFYDRLREVMLAAPEVESIGLVNPTAPESEEPFVTPLRFAGMPAEQQEGGVATSFYAVGPEFFSTLEIPTIAGRVFDRSDGADAPRAIVVGRSVAELMGGVDAAVGQTIRMLDREYSVIGVVDNAALGGPTADQRHDLQVYHSIYQSLPRLASMVIITRGGTLAAVPALRQKLAELAPTSAVDIVDDAKELLAWTYRDTRFLTLLVGAFTTSALGLAAIGLFAVLSNLVARSTMEIGVRRSLGATAASIRLLMLRRGIGVAACGLAIGMALSLLTVQALEGLLYAVSTFDATAFAAAAAVILLVAIAASLIPARRAAAVSPSEALRTS